MITRKERKRNEPKKGKKLIRIRGLKGGRMGEWRMRG